ncbi:uncharacterized protein DNG_09407 [Cephalotrichum gorgonifer]|uniref:R3H domain-containing protein n=1 Tax=Cephalotrichum gorgonifer TaxID=2041049 RepID=A0AAE8N7R4_9PEZI|nr:uncharacterized protein DNG_09407 [Cephalotrichum gorgonifer]
MATTQLSDIPKPSFAKVAASTSKDNSPVVSAGRIASSPTPPPVPAPVIANGANGMPPTGSMASKSAARIAVMRQPRPKEELVDGLVAGMRNTTIEPKTPSLVVNGSGSALAEKFSAISRESSSCDSHKADSTSDLGTKPPSLDGKSITSGTTFALDEKESLRPDDSASVKAAAAEDDDAFSIRDSLLASSRMGSDVAARRMLSEDSSDRRAPPYPAVAQAMTAEQDPAGAQPAASASISTDALNATYRKAPDDKLLEAMQSHKDRLFLLRLEKDVVSFIQDSKEPYMDLPPCNSFCRMLTHKLADYYHMTHSYEPSIGAVRIFRTPFCRVAPSLQSIVESTSAVNTPPPVVIPRKIMRREGSGDKTTSSPAPSKPVSEDGSEKDKAALAKEQMTREEREEAYNKARERIFGSSDKNGDSSQGNDNGVSRTSSVSTRDKSNVGRKGKNERRRRDSGTFESRTQYAVFYPPPQQSPWPGQPQYVPIATPQFNGQAPGQVQQPYPAQAAPVYGPPGPNYPTMVPGAGYPATYAVMQQYPPQPTQQRYPPAPGSSMGMYAPVPPGPIPQGSWQTPAFSPPPAPYPPHVAPPTTASNPGQTGLGPLGIPYQYGQLPVNVNPNDPKSQHPIPGSYNRHAFNPMTQSFVPNTGASPMQGQALPYPPPGSHHSSPQVGSPHLAYAPGFQPTVTGPPPLPQQPYGGGYAMARQGSNNSMMAFQHAPQHMQHPAPIPQVPHQPIPQHMQPSHPAQISNNMAPHQGSSVPGQSFSHLPPHYGNPASLPQKPT